MSPGNARPMGFTKLEVAFILVLVALVGMLAVTRFFDLSLTARQSVDTGVIAAVRQGISDYAMESRDLGRRPVYPPLLDHADTGEVTSHNRFFTQVIENGLAVSGSTKTGRHLYRGPNGESLSYDPNTGNFDVARNNPDAATPGPSGTRPPASSDN